MISSVCPFCYVATEHAHDSQQACIEALQNEIERTRELLAAVDAARASDPEPAADARDVQTT